MDAVNQISSSLLIVQITEALLPKYDANEARAIAVRCLDIGWDIKGLDVMNGKEIDLPADWTLKLARLATGEPLQYVLGAGFFRDQKYALNPSTLIPRPETEELVEWILPHLRDNMQVLDVGTGSGCIAVSLALAFKNGHISAWDVSAEALKMARKNSVDLGGRVEFCQQDIFSWRETEGLWDVIVSNPPYVLNSEAKMMDSNVLNFEPHIALFVPDQDPLKFYHALADFAWERLNDGGYLALEINRAFGVKILDLLRAMGFSSVQLRQDFFNQDRMVLAQKMGV